MIAFWIVFALVAIIALAVTTYNIVDGLRKAKKEWSMKIILKKNRQVIDVEYLGRTSKCAFYIDRKKGRVYTSDVVEAYEYYGG